MDILEIEERLVGKIIKSVKCIKQHNTRHHYEIYLESGETIVTGNFITSDKNFLCIEGIDDGGCHFNITS